MLEELFGVPKDMQCLDPLHVEKQITEEMISFCKAEYAAACNELRLVFADFHDEDIADALQKMQEGSILVPGRDLAGSTDAAENARQEYIKTREFWIRYVCIIVVTSCIRASMCDGSLRMHLLMAACAGSTSTFAQSGGHRETSNGGFKCGGANGSMS